jgi:hypothetical protein
MNVCYLVFVIALVTACTDNIFTILGEFYYPAGILTKKKFIEDLKHKVVDDTDINLTVDYANVNQSSDNKEIKTVTLVNNILTYKKVNVNEFEFNIYFLIPCQNVKYLIGSSDNTTDMYCDYLQDGIEGRDVCLKQLEDRITAILNGLKP